MADTSYPSLNGINKKLSDNWDGTFSEMVAVKNGGYANFDATIASGASLSGAVDLGMYRMFAIIMPASWTTANLTFQVSADGTNYFDLYDDTGTEVMFTAAASRVIQNSNPGRWLAFRYLKIRSGTSNSAVNQAAGRTITIVGLP
jgi:hypothetical protein